MNSTGTAAGVDAPVPSFAPPLLRPGGPASVLALTLQCGGGRDLRVLAVVRDPATNDTHPNVVSVPTQRYPRPLLPLLTDSARLPAGTEPLLLALPESDWQEQGRGGSSATVFLVETLLSRKLGLGDALEAGRVRFRARPEAFGRGFSHYERADGRVEREGIEMLNVRVVLERGADLIPPRTPSYSHLEWVPAADFEVAVRRRAPALLGGRFDRLEYCVHGLCITTAYLALFGKPPHESGAVP